MKPRIVASLLGSAILALAAGLAGGAPPVRAQAGCMADPLLCELMQRVIVTSTTTSDDQPVTVDLLPGALPTDSPLDLTMPDGSRLVGSVVTRVSGAFSSATVIFDSPLSVADTAAFYDDAEAEAGLSPLDLSGLSAVGGFQPTSRTDGRQFCNGSRGPVLTVGVSPGANGQTGVRLTVDARNVTICTIADRLQGLPSPARLRLPRLIAPSGVTVIPAGDNGTGSIGTVLFGGSSSSSGSGSSSSQQTPAPIESIAYATTDMSIADLEAAYDKQLQAAGWTRTGGDASPSFAWSTYDVTGANGGQGLLYVLDGPRQGQHTLHLELTQPH